jgi:hypothetical protein
LLFVGFRERPGGELLPRKMRAWQGASAGRGHGA